MTVPQTRYRHIRATFDLSHWEIGELVLVRRPIRLFRNVQNIRRDPANRSLFLSHYFVSLSIRDISYSYLIIVYSYQEIKRSRSRERDQERDQEREIKRVTDREIVREREREGGREERERQIEREREREREFFLNGKKTVGPKITFDKYDLHDVRQVSLTDSGVNDG